MKKTFSKYFLSFGLVGGIFLFTANSSADPKSGINPEVQIFNRTSETVTGVSVEGCNKASCEQPDSTSACTSSGSSSGSSSDAAKWSCHLDDVPTSLRFKVRTSNAGNTPRTSDYQPLVGGLPSDYAVHVGVTAVDAISIQDIVIQVNPQETLENVWDAETVKRLRAMKVATAKSTEIKSSQKFELTLCEFPTCKNGLLKTVPCTFSAQGASRLSYSCKSEPFARFAKIKFAGRDKIRSSDAFVLGSRFEVDLKASDVLEVKPVPTL